MNRERLPESRGGVTRAFKLVREHEGKLETVRFYFTANTYPDGRPGEIFVKGDKMGSLTSGALDACSMMISLLLQYGVPISVITSKLRHTRFEPDGRTRDQEFPTCSSPLDLLAQWLERTFGVEPGKEGK
jgi:ribonucleoside-diphosphate reductase alpha chain